MTPICNATPLTGSEAAGFSALRGGRLGGAFRRAAHKAQLDGAA